jgi:NADH:ubiquinone oxidoreductase subunit 5 (subunit L)/multisubunit Na+/H+ antiporter MnhA subunit
MRLLILTFVTTPNSSLTNRIGVHESPIAITLPLGILAVGSIIVGYLFKDLIIGVGTSFYGQAIEVLPQHVTLISAEFLSPIIK